MAGVHHFFTTPELLTGTAVAIHGDEARHAARVLRVREGERISVADGAGRLAHAVVTRVDPGAVEAAVESLVDLEPPVPELTLYQALVKGDRMDAVVQKAVEIGVRRVVPFAGERSVVRWDASRRVRAAERWRAVAHAAAKQSRSPWSPAIAPVADRAEPDEPLVLVLHERATTRLRDALPGEPPAGIGIVVGPEGGLTDGEASIGVAVTLGERVLRTETAGPVALALVSFVYGTLG